MAIVLTEIECIHGDVNSQRMIFYSCQESQGLWHTYGPVISNDPLFDANAHKSIVASKVAELLADAELEQVIV